MAVAVQPRVRWKAIRTTIAIVGWGAVITAWDCPNPVKADSETVYKRFALTGPVSSFAGDTILVEVDAENAAGEEMFETEPTWSVSSGAVKLVSTDAGHHRDAARFVLMQEGGTATITVNAGKGKMASGAQPTATHVVNVVGKPSKIVFFNAPHVINVGAEHKVWVQLQDAQGRKIDSRNLGFARTTLPVGHITEDLSVDTITFKGIAPGTVTIRVSLTADDMKLAGLTGTPISGEITFNVVGGPTGITFTPTSHTLVAGQSAQVNMLTTDAASNVLTGVEYEVTSLNTAVATVSNVVNGSFTINAVSSGTQPQTTAKISVKATRGGVSLTREFDVTVHSRIAGISVAPSPVRVNPGMQQPLAPNVTFVGGANPTPAPIITWESSNTNKATVNNQGVVTGVANTGTSRVLITAISEGVRSTPAEVQVGPFGMAFVPAAVTMTVGASRTMVLEERDSSGIALPGVNVPNANVDWSSSANAIATVSADGVVHCETPGTTTIMAVLKNTAMQAAGVVTCGNATPVASIVLDPVEYTTVAGGNVQFQARLFDAQGNETNAANGFHVTYTVTTSAIAELVGQSTSGLVLGKAPGTTTVNAYYVAVGGGTPLVSAQSTLRVGNATPGQVATVRITQTHLLASPGVSQGLTAIAHDINGNVVNGVTFQWSKLLATTPVTVNANTGVVTANSTGGNTIFASAVLPGDIPGPTGVTAVTVRSAGAVQGTVHKHDGTPAAGATIRAWMGGNVMMSGIVAVNSPTPGRAYVPGLLAGTYTITVSMPGHQVRRFENVVVTAEQVVVLNGGQPIVLQQQ